MRGYELSFRFGLVLSRKANLVLFLSAIGVSFTSARARGFNDTVKCKLFSPRIPLVNFFKLRMQRNRYPRPPSRV